MPHACKPSPEILQLITGYSGAALLLEWTSLNTTGVGPYVSITSSNFTNNIAAQGQGLQGQIHGAVIHGMQPLTSSTQQSLNIANCDFLSNQAGALNLTAVDITMDSCRVNGNNGSAIMLLDVAHASVKRSQFTKNTGESNLF